MYDVRPMPEPIPEDLLEGLRSTDTGTVGHIIDSGFMDPGIQGRLSGAKIAGMAVTVHLPVSDSLMGHYPLKYTRPGDILVIERGPDQLTSCWGGSTSVAAARLGLGGLIMDGAGNDISEANAVGLPIWCRHITPVTTKFRNLGGAMNVPISCGGVVVHPGDAILADENGVLVIPRARLSKIIRDAAEVGRKELEFRAFMRDNPDLAYPDASGASKLIEAALVEGCETAGS